MRTLLHYFTMATLSLPCERQEGISLSSSRWDPGIIPLDKTQEIVRGSLRRQPSETCHFQASPHSASNDSSKWPFKCFQQCMTPSASSDGMELKTEPSFACLSGFQDAGLFCSHSPLRSPRKYFDFVCSTFFFLVAKMGVTTFQFFTCQNWNQKSDFLLFLNCYC